MTIAASGSDSYSDSAIQPQARQILTYWLGSEVTGPNSFPAEKMQLWFKGGPEQDKDITDNFGGLLRHAAEKGLDHWQGRHNGLAAVILMDQFSRNVYRGSAQMYSLDQKAVLRAKEMLANGDAAKLALVERVWLALPLMHSEDVQDQQMCVSTAVQMLDEAKTLQDAAELQKFLGLVVDYAVKHLKVVEQWGRFPHRNDILSRASTPEEVRGMADGAIPSF